MPILCTLTFPSIQASKAWRLLKAFFLTTIVERHLVGIDIDNASRKMELTQLSLSKLPLTVQTITA
jgi:hypothetical protein